jgi:ferredoxin
LADRPTIQFIPASTDEGKIRFFGTLMPALLLLKASPVQFVRFQILARLTPRASAAEFIESGTDDTGQVGDVWLFIHRWHTSTFDPLTFGRAKTFLARLTRLVRRAGCEAEPLDPLSPRINLPKLAAQAGLGNLSPFELLVHPTFGPRLIISGLRTNFPLTLSPRWTGKGCTDCLACLRACPQEPVKNKVVSLRLCQTCAQCLAVCPVGDEA